ncbi:U3 snoRNP protein [Massospora cicadina]|nr:U3 snoRNP protein [Massospora cicadina]
MAFEGQNNTDKGLHKAKNFERYLTPEASLRRPSPLKTLLEEISFKAKDPISGELKEYKVSQEAGPDCPIGLNQAQQYGNGLGLAPLRDFFRQHTQQLHKPCYQDWDVIPTAGNTDSLYKMLSLFLMPKHPILVARWCYPTALETFTAFGLQLLSVDIDEEGLVPSSLKDVAGSWNQKNPGNSCRFMYTVPCGQNPTGATMSLARRQQIYKVAQELELIIFEDDPYYYLQLPPFNPNRIITSERKEDMDAQEFIDVFGYKSLTPSLLSLDVDGRVVRMDSWAKTIAPGFRVGWITAQSSLILKLQFINEVSIQMPSGFSQSILAQLLIQGWGNGKLEQHVAALRLQFTYRRDSIMSILMPVKGKIVDFTPPVAGMFLWLKPCLPKDMLTLEGGTLPSYLAMEKLFNALIEKHVVIVPGVFFDTNNYAGEGKHLSPQLKKGAPYLRVCYTFANLGKVIEGTQRMVEALKAKRSCRSHLPRSLRLSRLLPLSGKGAANEVRVQVERFPFSASDGVVGSFSNLCGTVFKRGNVLFTPDGNTLISPVGNRVTLFNLVQNRSVTLPVETSTDIVALALSPNGSLVFVADEAGHGFLVHLARKFILHRFNFHGRVRDLKFSPDGKLFAYALDKKLTPFVKVRELVGHFDDVTTLNWSSDSKFIITGSKDMTCKVFAVGNDELPCTLAGHKDSIHGCFFSKDNAIIYTVSRDGICLEWQYTTLRELLADKGQDVYEGERASKNLDTLRWLYVTRNCLGQPGSRVISTAFHPAANLLLVGFSKGTFGLWELPDFVNIHTLSISQTKVDTVAINITGEWLAFGTTKFGQLLVWEWQSESYVLKQQGHHFELNAMAYSPDAQTIATGGQDGKVKLWNTGSGFCFVTFADHTGPVTGVEFAKGGQIVLSASRDGTVRAFDLLRYRNFRTFTTPEPVQLSCLAVDPSGELVCAGSIDTFEVFVWSMQSGKLLEVLAGHTGPVSCMAFSPADNLIATGSWDKTVRVWDVFGRGRHVEMLQIDSEVLALAYRPDGAQLAVASLNGQVTFWNPAEGAQTGSIEARDDIAGGRLASDLTRVPRGTYFNSLGYTCDGNCIIAGGDTKFVCIYDTATAVLIRKFQISRNRSLNGTQEKLNSSQMTEAGPLSLIDDVSDDPAVAKRYGRDTLPGVARGDLSVRRTRPEVRTMGVRFAPTGRAWAAASTEGLLIFSLDDTLLFDPVDLDVDITPATLRATLEHHDFLLALSMAFRLNEKAWIRRALEAVPPSDVPLIARAFPVRHLPALLKFLGGYAETNCRHLEFLLLWCHHLLLNHAPALRQDLATYLPPLRALLKVLGRLHSDLGALCDANLYLTQYLTRGLGGCETEAEPDTMA